MLKCRQIQILCAIAVLGASAIVGGSCAFIEFEKGAYVVRDLTAVYSQQEDVTFLSWKLREDANLNRVSFELLEEGAYREIDLEETLFPASPYNCAPRMVCFQYQLKGRYELPEERSAVRTHHDDRGIFAGDGGESIVAETTVGIEPIAVDNNRRIEPGVVDWFEQNDVPLRRGWQWQLIDASGTRKEPTDCSGPEGDWGAISGDRGRSGSVGVDYEWVARPKCLALRPDGESLDEAVVRAPLPPSAETVVTRQSYSPDKIEAPIYYGVLLDMSIQNKDRCKSVRSSLLDVISGAMKAQGEPTKMGGYRPISPDSGEALNGCDQVPGRSYPIAKMIQDAAEIDGQLSPERVRIVFIYINNSPLPLSEQLRRDLRDLNGPLAEQNDLDLSNWTIGSSRVLGIANWDRQIGWRPISSDTFQGVIESTADAALPYSTMDHEAERNIPIEPPASEERPVRFKVCRSTPLPVRIGATAEPPDFTVSDPSVPWPAEQKPYFRVGFQPQILVPSSAYTERKVDLVIEACDRFCDHRFKTQGGGIYSSWSRTSAPQPMEVCKWQP